MRTFDYRHLPQGLFDGKVGDANVRLYEDKGKLQLLERDHSEQLDALRAEAHLSNVDASARIEGLYVDVERARALIAGEATPADETEAQIVGYSNALRLVEGAHAGAGAEGRSTAEGAGANASAGSRAAAGRAPSERGPELGLSTTTILTLYETLYAHRELGRKSRYRKKDHLFVQVDGHPQAMPVSPITAFETPLVLGGACDSLADAFVVDTCSPLILNAVFTVDFLCIRPFDEGNGRIARLFANLMLDAAGFGVFRYMSVDRVIEREAMGYYDALNACVDKWDRAANDYTPYVLFWLDAVHQAYQELFAKIDLHLSANNSKSELVRLYVRQAQDAVSKRQIMAALPSVSEATVENVLGDMVKRGEVRKVGAGRATAYRWVDA